MDSMSELPTWARDALAGIYDPCCREKGISVLDMGLVRSVQVEDGVAKVELLLTSGWCPFAASVLNEVKSQIVDQPGISDADVSIVWDEAWTTDRLSPRARDILRFLPSPAAVDKSCWPLLLWLAKGQLGFQRSASPASPYLALVVAVRVERHSLAPKKLITACPVQSVPAL